MTTFLFIRHGDTDDVDEALAGQIDSPLNAEGFTQAGQLAIALSHLPIDFIFSSPLLRARQTAAPLAKALNLPVAIEPGFNQVNFGKWQGVDFRTLEQDPQWQAFQRNPVEMHSPGGDSAVSVLQRVEKTIYSLAEQHPSPALIAVFTHGSIVRHSVGAMISLPLKNFNYLRIAPASVTTLSVKNKTGKLLHLNQQVPVNWR
ncbi:MAG: phosphoglycerate mutase [Chloroflexi bacterium HGW-Chloroflexi-10]|nr:MAG: phosphoglycerate mutase [Chloroflexi bacterium HGW-Chloroflexi-10]